jgi:hypothetical protein
LSDVYLGFYHIKRLENLETVTPNFLAFFLHVKDLMSINPRYIPIIPKTPAKFGGAGIGRFKKPNKAPTINPLIVAINI